MAQGMERPRDVVGGLLVVVIGAGFFLSGRELEMGTSFRMGPGYFPTILSLLMVALGAVMTVLAWRGPHEEGAFGHVPWRGLILVVGAVLAFGLTLRGLGLGPVVVLVVQTEDRLVAGEVTERLGAAGVEVVGRPKGLKLGRAVAHALEHVAEGVHAGVAGLPSQLAVRTADKNDPYREL